MGGDGVTKVVSRKLPRDSSEDELRELQLDTAPADQVEDEEPTGSWSPALRSA